MSTAHRAGLKVVYEVGRNREAGATIQVIDNRQGDFESHDGDRDMFWVTLCDTHGNYCLHRTRALAEEFAHHPAQWCQTCADEGEAREKQTQEQSPKDANREIDERVYFAVFESWAVDAREVARATDLNLDVVNASLRRLERKDLLASEHINSERTLTWQSYFDIDNDPDAEIGARAAFNAAFPSGR